jgi:hypothetical protein
MMQAAPMMVYPGNEKLEQHLRPATWKVAAAYRRADCRFSDDAYRSWRPH